jgi:parallel beta-helix repeat protein
MQIPRSLLIACTFLALLNPQDGRAQGSLTPSAAPSSTMKTLQQIEPRIDLANAPAGAVVTTDTDNHYIINQAGSYYLSDNLTVTKTNGILINSAGVTLDLRGFSINRQVLAGTGAGISLALSASRTRILNGNVTNFDTGIQVQTVSELPTNGTFRDLAVENCRIGMSAGFHWRLENCRSNACGFSGLSAGAGSAFVGCTVSNLAGVSGTPGIAGINTGATCTLTDCTVRNCIATYGISASSGCTLTNCTVTASSSGETAIYAASASTLLNCSVSQGSSVFYAIEASGNCALANCAVSAFSCLGGISALGGSSIQGCTVSNCTTPSGSSVTCVGFLTTGACTVTRCTATSNPGGFSLDAGSTIESCTASSNTIDGIKVLDGCTVRNNDCNANSTGAGIHVTGTNNRIEGNNVTRNKNGIQVDATVNLVISNSARSNTTSNYTIVAGNRIGLIVAPATSSASGNTGGTTFSAESWANIGY